MIANAETEIPKVTAQADSVIWEFRITADDGAEFSKGVAKEV